MLIMWEIVGSEYSLGINELDFKGIKRKKERV